MTFDEWFKKNYEQELRFHPYFSAIKAAMEIAYDAGYRQCKIDNSLDEYR